MNMIKYILHKTGPHGRISSRQYSKCILLSIFLPLIFACEKDYLDIKSSKDLVVPTTIMDLQALQDNSTVMNQGTSGYREIASDDNIVTPHSFQSLAEGLRNTYIWNKDFIYPSLSDWTLPYRRIYYSNIVLHGIELVKQEAGNQDAWNNVKGGALFHRAFAFWDLLQTFAKPYNSASANTDLGVPLKLTYDVLEKYNRASIQDCYEQIVTDLLTAEPLLPLVPLNKTRPSRPAVNALLARVCLTMGDYDMASAYASEALNLYGTLIDYNNLDSSLWRPLVIYNDETIFFQTMGSNVALPPISGLVDSTLYKSYTDNDLRKLMFFTPSNGALTFKGFYSGGSSPFSGLATDELYLIRAECLARKGDVSSAMSDLNTLLIKRWKQGSFKPLSALTSDEALSIILKERRKELLYRGLRWVDLRRLNLEGRFTTTITRVLGEDVYTLSPNDSRYVFPIPTNEIELSGIEQNIR